MSNQDYLKMEQLTKNFLDTLNLDKYITESIDNYNIIKKQTDKFMVRNK